MIGKRPHIVDGEFQSDKYPTCPRGKVPLSTKDPTAQDLLWEYAQRRRSVDAEFSDDLEFALRRSGYRPKPNDPTMRIDVAHCRRILIDCRHGFEDKALAFTALDGALNEIERMRAALEPPPVTDGEDAFLAECASRCRNCTDCGQPVPCGACLAGGVCDAWCDCDRNNDDLRAALKATTDSCTANTTSHRRRIEQLEGELATIAEKTAREQRQKCADEWRGFEDGIRVDLSDAIMRVPLVTDTPSKPEKTSPESPHSPARTIAPQGGKELGQPCEWDECGEPGRAEFFRRKNDGLTEPYSRCATHRGLCNSQWESAPPPPESPAETRCKHGAPNCGGHYDDE